MSNQLFPIEGEILPTDGSAVLLPAFLDHITADDLLTELLGSLRWEEPQLMMFGKSVTEPRLSTWHADPGLNYTYSGLERIAQPWTTQLLHVRQLCETVTSHTFNGVLVNLYRNGSDHLGWHSDDEKVNGPEPIIASISLGADRRFDFRHRDTKEVVSTTLSHGSLLVMSGLSQKCWVHRLPKTPRLEQPRINLTFRHLFPQ
ncbi:unannotated protein [freshwater metagenome]|uniref:Unannotated protein n=1 Tax=freshwater metagenome TaxID=449393 RepID=A0A6J6FYU5_9ZZZZ|nr:alpha-ketoglutarate-dependent dioxygenase AlkB [Actinomycetota bacterium]